MKGAHPGSLESALSLIGRGKATSIVGQLRPEVTGVDIDAPASLGDLAREMITDWAASRRLWHLARPSGGGPGRWHVYIVHGVRARDLYQLVSDIKRELGLKPVQLGVRDHLRPLSAPHRRTGLVTPIQGEPAALYADLLSLLPDQPRTAGRRRGPGSPKTATGTRARSASVAGSGPAAALSPLARRRRELPLAWHVYFREGRATAGPVDRDPTPALRSRSTPPGSS